MNKHEMAEQTRLAFDFIQKLYLEVSYLVKEVEGLLGSEDEHFVIGRPSGYGITVRSSTGLEPGNVALWAPRSLAVFFVPESIKHLSRGQTDTPIAKDTCVIYLRIILGGREMNEPVIFTGILHSMEKKSSRSWPEKFEQVMAHIEYRDTQVFRILEEIDYEDAYVAFKGKLIQVPLFDLNTSDDVYNKVVTPALAMFRQQVAQ